MWSFNCLFVCSSKFYFNSIKRIYGDSTYFIVLLLKISNFIISLLIIIYIINLIVLSTLFVKICSFLPRGFQPLNAKFIQTILYTFPLIGTEILILLVFTIIDPPIHTETFGFSAFLVVQLVTSETKTKIFFIVQLAFDGLLLNNKTNVFSCLFIKSWEH